MGDDDPFSANFAHACFEGGAEEGCYEGKGCGICLEPITSRGQISCEHLFCFDCIKRWAGHQEGGGSPTCPVCKVAFREITKVDSDPLDEIFGKDRAGADLAPKVVERVGRRTRRQQRATRSEERSLINDSSSSDRESSDGDFVGPAPPAQQTRRSARTRTRAAAAASGRPPAARASRLRSSRARAAQQEHRELDLDDDEALALAIAQSMAEADAQGAISSSECRRQRQPRQRTAAAKAAVGGRRREPSRKRSSSKMPHVARKRFLIDPITGQRLRCRRFPPQANDKDMAGASKAGSPEMAEPEGPPCHDPETLPDRNNNIEWDDALDGRLSKLDLQFQQIESRAAQVSNLTTVETVDLASDSPSPPSPLWVGGNNAPATAASRSGATSDNDDDGSDSNVDERSDIYSSPGTVDTSLISTCESQSGDLMSRLAKRLKASTAQ